MKVAFYGSNVEMHINGLLAWAPLTTWCLGGYFLICCYDYHRTLKLSCVVRGAQHERIPKETWKHHVGCESLPFIFQLTSKTIFIYFLFSPVWKGQCFVTNKWKWHCLCLWENKYVAKCDFFYLLKRQRHCGNTLNRPASDSRPLLWEKSTYFLSVRLAVCLLEGLTQSTCCCMCSQRSPRRLYS